MVRMQSGFHSTLRSISAKLAGGVSFRLDIISFNSVQKVNKHQNKKMNNNVRKCTF